MNSRDSLFLKLDNKLKTAEHLKRMAPIALVTGKSPLNATRTWSNNTGANSGIGFAISSALAASKEAYHVIMAGRSISRVEAAIGELTRSGYTLSSFYPLQLDVDSEDSVKKAASEVASKFGHLDVLINNAGIQKLDGSVGENFLGTLRTNVVGPYLVAQAFDALLKESAAPKTIYISSSTGSFNLLMNHESPYRSTGNGTVWYRSSKSALNMVAMHDQLVNEGTKHQVYAVCPGLVISNLRGTSEEARLAGGRAQDPATSANLILSVLRGERDAAQHTLLGTIENHSF